MKTISGPISFPHPDVSYILYYYTITNNKSTAQETQYKRLRDSRVQGFKCTRVQVYRDSGVSGDTRAQKYRIIVVVHITGTRKKKITSWSSTQIKYTVQATHRIQ